MWRRMPQNAPVDNNGLLYSLRHKNSCVKLPSSCPPSGQTQLVSTPNGIFDCQLEVDVATVAVPHSHTKSAP
jgi:hypothetical protein